MPYSGADVLAQLSELARQQAGLPRALSIMIVSHDQAEGDLLQSALRAVVGYETRIFVATSMAEALKLSKVNPPQIGFCLDNAPLKKAGCEDALRMLRDLGLACPVAIVRNSVTPQIRCKLLDLGATDVLNRDEFCGIRLRECLVRLLEARALPRQDTDEQERVRLTLVSKD